MVSPQALNYEDIDVTEFWKATHMGMPEIILSFLKIKLLVVLKKQKLIIPHITEL